MLRKSYLESKTKLSGQDFEFEFVASFGKLKLYDTTNY